MSLLLQGEIIRIALNVDLGAGRYSFQIHFDRFIFGKKNFLKREAIKT